MPVSGGTTLGFPSGPKPAALSFPWRDLGRPGLSRKQEVEGALPGWHSEFLKVHQTAAPPHPTQPFLLWALCSVPSDLGTRPFYAAAGLHRPTQAGDFLFMWRLQPWAQCVRPREWLLSPKLGESASRGGGVAPEEQQRAGRSRRQPGARGQRLPGRKGGPLPGGVRKGQERDGLAWDSSSHGGP